MRLLRNLFLFALLLATAYSDAQVKLSIASDVSILHNFDGKQKFTVIGQTVLPQWHLDKKTTLYAWFTYHTNGKYKSNLLATAKSPATQPQTIAFTNNSQMRLRQFSLGIKKYFIGAYDTEDKFNLYGGGGFGLIVGTASNNFSTFIDTSLYTIQNNVVNGSGDFKRLTLDILGGLEFPVSYDFYVYTEMRLHIPTTNYPNNYLLKNSNAPFLAGINIGIRILFDADP